MLLLLYLFELLALLFLLDAPLKQGLPHVVELFSLLFIDGLFQLVHLTFELLLQLLDLSITHITTNNLQPFVKVLPL